MSQDLLKSNRSLFWWLQLGGWGAFGISMILAVWVVDTLSAALREKTLYTLLGFLSSLPLRVVYRRVYQRQLPLFWIILICAACAYVAALGWVTTHSISAGWLAAWEKGAPYVWPGWTRTFSGVSHYTFVLLTWSLLYFGVKHYRDLQAQTERALQAEALAQQAQLQALRYQLNPHFLFNTLNAISTLIAQNQNAAANRMITRLSEFLRLTLEGDSAQEAPLAAELDFVRRYLDIEQVRMGDRLQVRFDIAPEAQAVPVPVMILQPLIENAIRHSIAPRETGGRIEIVARCTESALQLEVCDDGPITASGLASLQPGIGLINTQARLRQLYGAAQRFRLAARANGGLRVQLELPLPNHRAL